MDKINGMSGRAVWASRSFALAAILLTAVTGDAMSQTVVMKLSTATLNDTQHEWMKRFAAAVEKNSNGRIKGEVYPASQLGAIPRQIEGVQLGSIQAWIGPPEFLVGVDPRFEVMSVPSLFKDDNHAIKVMQDPEFSKVFLAMGTNKGLVGGALYPSGMTGFVSRTPLRTLADFRGKKIRVLASPFQIEQLTKIGGTGVPMTLGDVLPALQQGTLDGAMSNLPVFAALQYYESAKYFTETFHSFVSTVTMFSKRWYDALPPDLQSTVMTASLQLSKDIVPYYRDFAVAQRKLWIDKGGEVLALSAADRAELLQKMAPIGPDIVKSKPDLKPIWEQLVAAAKRNE